MDVEIHSNSGATHTKSSLYRKVLDACSYGIILLGKDQRIKLVNTWFSKTSDIPELVAIDATLPVLFPETEGSRLMHAVKQALRHNVSSTLSQSIHKSPLPLYASAADRTRDQRMLQSIRVIPVDIQGNQRYCLIQINDITETIKREQYLEYQNQVMGKLADEKVGANARFEAIFNHIPDGLITLTKGSIIEHFNPAAEVIFGYKAAEVVGQPLRLLAPKKYLVHYQQILDHIVKLGALSPHENRQEMSGLVKSGEEVPLEVKISPVSLDGHDCVVISLRDVSRRKMLEKQIYREKEFAHITLESISDAVVTTDKDGKVNYLNPVARSMSGWHSEDPVGQSFVKFFNVTSFDDEENLHSVISRSLRQTHQAMVTGIYIFRTRHDKSYTIKTHVSSMHDGEGRGIGAVIVFRDVTKEMKLKSQLTYHACHDELTGLLNRREFERHIANCLEPTDSDYPEHCMCYIDLDRFKIVNDTCGHIAGDELLRQLTTLVQDNIRASDALARLGGDEFGLLLRRCSEARAKAIAENIREAIEKFRFSWGEKQFTVSASIGLVPIRPDALDLDSVLSAADNACYEAKRNGRNRVCVYEPDNSEFARHHGDVHWAHRISAAIEENRLTLYAQRIAPMGTEDQALQCEILIRMQDDDGSDIPPMAFIPAAERFNLMPKIDAWVVRSTLNFLVENADFAKQVGCCAINLSGQSLSDETFLDNLVQQIQASSVPPEIICFEVTETAAISNLGKVKHFMERVKEMGCKFSLDDFGSGVSSFGYLKNLPVDRLKIDGVFVKDMVEDPIDCAMVEAINNIGQVMGLETVAEFVENDAILEKLREIGVDYVQGYGIARPQPLTTFIE